MPEVNSTLTLMAPSGLVCGTVLDVKSGRLEFEVYAELPIGFETDWRMELLGHMRTAQGRLRVTAGKPNREGHIRYVADILDIAERDRQAFEAWFSSRHGQVRALPVTIDDGLSPTVRMASPSETRAVLERLERKTAARAAHGPHESPGFGRTVFGGIRPQVLAPPVVRREPEAPPASFTGRGMAETASVPERFSVSSPAADRPAPSGERFSSGAPAMDTAAPARLGSPTPAAARFSASTATPGNDRRPSAPAPDRFASPAPVARPAPPSSFAAPSAVDHATSPIAGPTDSVLARPRPPRDPGAVTRGVATRVEEHGGETRLVVRYLEQARYAQDWHQNIQYGGLVVDLLLDLAVGAPVEVVLINPIGRHLELMGVLLSKTTRTTCVALLLSEDDIATMRP